MRSAAAFGIIHRKGLVWLLAITVLTAAITAFTRAADGPPGPPPPVRGAGGRDHGGGVTTRPHASTMPTTRPLSVLRPGERRAAVTFTGGHDTDPVDHGRPVVLIAAAMGVPAVVFRETFTHVHPAGPGSGGPTDAEARQNKAALMKGLSPYSVTDDRINTVSNRYRYMKQNPGDLWDHREATAFAVIGADGKIARFDLVDAGSAYSTPPTAVVESMPGVAVTVKLTFGTDLETNGSIESLLAPSDGRRLQGVRNHD